MFEVGDRVQWRWDEYNRTEVVGPVLGVVIAVCEDGRVGGVVVLWDRVVARLASVVDALARLVST